MSTLINTIPNESTSKLSRAVAGPARTVVQLVPAAIIVEIVDSTFWNMDDRQYAAILAGGLLLTSYVQNAYEQYKNKSLFR